MRHRSISVLITTRFTESATSSSEILHSITSTCHIQFLKTKSTKHCPSYYFLIRTWSHCFLESFPCSMSWITKCSVLMVSLKEFRLSLQTKWLCLRWLVLRRSLNVINKFLFLILKDFSHMRSKGFFTRYSKFSSMSLCISKRFLIHYK